MGSFSLEEPYMARTTKAVGKMRQIAKCVVKNYELRKSTEEALNNKPYE